MNKKFIISLGLAAIISTTIAAYADSTIYTDGIGRIHFLGRDAANNKAGNYNYTNSAEQDLTRRLYEKTSGEVVNDSTYSQHPLKNYENTFPDSRFDSNYWKNRSANRTEEDYAENAEKAKKTTVTATKGATDYSGQYAYGSTILDNPSEKNVVKTTAKKHWWNKKSKKNK